MIPSYILTVLERMLPDVPRAHREAVAEALHEALPLMALVEPCRASIVGQLAHRAGIAVSDDTAAPMARNIVQSIACALGEL